MKKIMQFIKRNIIYLLISFIFITITSKMSPIYPLNDWCDTNSFFTMGKALIRGKIIYKDLFEQKGPLLYLIYGVGYLISNKTFIGVYILEILSYSLFLKIIKKILTTLEIKKFFYYAITLSFIITTSLAFYGGGSAEEFCLPYICWNIYIFTKIVKDKKISNIEHFIDGLCFSTVFLIKFNVATFWIGTWIIYIIIYKKESIKKIMYFTLGASILPLLVVLYFLKNSALYEFIDVYFLKNIFEYNHTKMSIISFFSGFLDGILNLFIYNIHKNFFLIIALILSFLYAKNNKIMKQYILLLIFPFIFLCCQKVFFEYYILPFSILSIFGLIIIFEKIKIDKINKKYLLIILVIMTFIFGKNTYMLKYKKEDYAQYSFQQIINKYEDKSLLNYGFIDTGFYLETNEVPNVRFFHTMNFSDFKEMKEGQLNYIKNKKTNFVICAKVALDQECNAEIKKNYKLITEKRHNKDYGFYYELYVRK